MAVTTPTEGAGAIANARRCPNDDGTQVLRLNSRLKVVVLALGDAIPVEYAEAEWLEAVVAEDSYRIPPTQ